MDTRNNRRGFLKSTTASGLGLLLLNGKTARGYAANEKLNIALIGASGQGGSNAGNVASENIVAICDVDQPYAEPTFKRFEAAKRFIDFRQMLDQMHKEIDAVVVSTPDHTHAVAAIAAMQLNKHVYCEKPLARTVREARAMREVARKQKVVTQMGNQGSASEGLRRGTELAWGGAVGTLKEAHVWFGGGNNPIDRPKEEPSVPAGLDWNLWLGPAPQRPFNPVYVRGGWRNWRAFGTGSMGDFWCHSVNMAFRGLRMDLLWNPEASAGSSSPGVIRVECQTSELHPESYSRWNIVRYQIPARGKLPPATFTWYNGGPHPAPEILPEQAMTEHGSALVGEKGVIFSDCPWNTRCALLPKKQFEGAPEPASTLPRSPGHHAEWIQACKGGPKPFSSFDIGALLAELALVGNVALSVGHPIDYEPVAGKIVNCAEANALLHREYRSGWSL